VAVGLNSIGSCRQKGPTLLGLARGRAKHYPMLLDPDDSRAQLY